MRFGEDHLRMLRAVRFSANFGFPLESQTRNAIERLSKQLELVSPERLAAELRLMVSREGVARLRLLAATGLVHPLFGDQIDKTEAFWASASDVLDKIHEPSLPVAMAILCRGDIEAVVGMGNHLRLSNSEKKLSSWLVKALSVLSSKNFARLFRCSLVTASAVACP